ncbi:MAG: PH domain-containing protein [Cardiobacteriaceae bacterium]|nr:PH domain-containing protein [Cardiobacteriaceae bacterium]
MLFTLPSETRNYWRIIFLLSLTLQSALFLAIYWFLFIFLERLDSLKPFFWTLISVVIIGKIFSLIYIELRFKRTNLTLGDAFLTLRQGVFWRSETLIIRSRLQYADIKQSPLERKFGLASLILFTAGTRLPTLIFPPMRESDVRSIRDQLSGQIMENKLAEREALS